LDESQNENQGESQDSELPQSEANNQGSQSPFTSGRFAGKTIQEVEEMMASAEQVALGNARSLRNIESRLQERETNQNNNSGRESPLPEISAAEFFDDPVKHNAEMTRRIIKEEMAEIIAPFKQNLVQQERSQAYQQIEAKYPLFKKLRALVEQALELKKLAPTYANLEEAYFIARGVAAEQGYDLSDGENGGQNQSRQAPPQHRPSNQPLSRQKEGQKQRRRLTEEEKKFCRDRGWSEERFLKEMEADEEEFMNIEEKKNA